MNSYFIGTGCVLLLFLLYFEKKESIIGIFISKPLLSFLFVLAAWLQPGANQAYEIWILSGLVFSLIGDVCLIFTSRKLFLAGLTVFLLGHICYSIAFFTNATISAWTWGALAVIVATGAVIFSWLRPFLGNMMKPVIAYVVIISLMVCNAATVMGDPGISLNGRWLVFIGAIVFYLSDIGVARQQFVRSEYINRAVGLPLYYLGQFMFAFSIAYL